jgi:hypothetical protein
MCLAIMTALQNRLGAQLQKNNSSLVLSWLAPLRFKDWHVASFL